MTTVLSLMSRREELGLTQKQIADHIGSTVQTVSNWENGVSKPRLTIDKTYKLAEILQTDLKGLQMMFG